MALDFSQLTEVLSTIHTDTLTENQNNPNQEEVQANSLAHLNIDAQVELAKLKSDQKKMETSKAKVHKNKKVERCKGCFDKTQNKKKKKSQK